MRLIFLLKMALYSTILDDTTGVEINGSLSARDYHGKNCDGQS
jgi:hypothetical protein